MVHIMQLKHSPVTVVLEQPVCLLNPCFVLRPLSIIHLWCYLRSPWTGNRGSFSRLPGGARRLRCQYPPQTKGPDRLDPIFLCPPVKRVLYQFRTQLVCCLPAFTLSVIKSLPYFWLPPLLSPFFLYHTLQQDSSPLSCWSMKGVKVQPALPRAVGGKYLLQFIFPDSSQKGVYNMCVCVMWFFKPCPSLQDTRTISLSKLPFSFLYPACRPVYCRLITRQSLTVVCLFV